MTLAAHLASSGRPCHGCRPASCVPSLQAVREWLASQGRTLEALFKAVSQGRIEDVRQLLVALQAELCGTAATLTVDDHMSVLLGYALQGNHVDAMDQPCQSKSCDRCNMACFLLQQLAHATCTLSSMQAAAVHGHAAVIPRLASVCNSNTAQASLGSALRAVAGARTCSTGRFEAVEALLAAGALPTALVPGMCA